MVSPEGRSDRVPVGYELDIEADNGSGTPPVYHRTGRVTGELLVGQDSYPIDTVGGWSHEWAPRD